MHFDLKRPIGCLFSIYGALLAVYGALGDRAEYARSLGINVNVAWGVLMLVFGVALLTLRRRRP